ncbi:MAG: hypothetical protein JXA77_01485 [Bacteroidales bacterium]|nr:hypothetical protein [Bacteroidales bacterium]MBN2820200.1 hypothetical protein [Bacteroidales bacterium]
MIQIPVIKIAFISFVLLFISKSAISQFFRPEDYRKDLSIKLEVIDEKRIEKGVKILNEAYVAERKTIMELETLAEDEKLKATSPEYKKIVKSLISTSEQYREGHMIIYTVFQENCVKFGDVMKKQNHTAKGINKAMFYERKGTRAYEKSMAIRDLINMLEKPDLIQYKMAEALELEKLSIRDRGRSVQIYQDFPVEYNYGWDDDVSDEEVAAAFKDPAISLPPADLFIQNKKPETTETSTGNPEMAAIVFKIQIAAHTLKISDDQLRESIYNGPLQINEAFEENWYKYTIGEFDNFNEASKLLKQSRVSKAFVVAYQGGKRLPIKDALAIIRENQ